MSSTLGYTQKQTHVGHNRSQESAVKVSETAAIGERSPYILNTVVQTFVVSHAALVALIHTANKTSRRLIQYMMFLLHNSVLSHAR